jgi:hypothetical protein
MKKEGRGGDRGRGGGREGGRGRKGGGGRGIGGRGRKERGMSRVKIELYMSSWEYTNRAGLLNEKNL